MGTTKQRKSERKSGGGWLVPALLVAGMVLAAIGGFILVSNILLPVVSQPAGALDDNKALGPVDAPVRVVVYSDYQ